MFRRTHGRLAVALGLCILSIAAGCQRRQEVALGDEAKRQRIEAMYREYRKSFPDTPEVTVSELLLMQEKEEVVVVDAREPREREVSMIPNAISVEELEANLEKYKEHTIVTYCTVGYRSGLLASELRGKNLRAFNLKGSILSWVHEGQPLTHEGQETRRVHVYGPEWDLAPEGYEAVW